MKRKLLIWFLTLVLLATPLALAENDATGFIAGEVTDGLGRVIALKEAPRSIVSLSPANTEILCALGVGDLLVGVDSYSDYPAEVTALARMGDYSGPNVELIAAAGPDVVFTSTKLQLDAIEKLEALGLTVVCVEPTNLEEIYTGIELIARVVGVDSAPLVTELKERFDTIAGSIPAKVEPVKVYFALTFGDSGDYSAGPGTFIDELIALAGAKNVAAEAEYAWPMYSLEGIVAADPDVILVADYGDGSAVGQLMALERYQVLRAVRDGQVYGIADSLVSRPGPRIADGLAQIVNALAQAGAYEQDLACACG